MEERLEVARVALESVLQELGPMNDAVACIVEGRLQVALEVISGAMEIVPELQ